MLLGGSRWSAGRVRRGDAVCRALRAAGRHHVPPRPSVRRAASLLRRRSRHRTQSEAARARQGSRPRHPGRRRGSAKCRRRATRCSTFRRRARRFVHVHPGAEELGRVYRPHLAIHAAPTAFAAALEGLQPPNEIRWRGETATAHGDYLAWTEKATPQPGRRQSRRDHGVAARAAAGRRHHLQRRRQFRHLDPSLLPLPPLRHPAGADLRLDGLRRAGRGRRRSASIPSARSCASPATAIS